MTDGVEKLITPEVEEVLGRLSENVGREDIEKAQEDERDDSTQQEEKKTSPETEKKSSEPYLQFASKKEAQDWIDSQFSERFERIQAKAEREKEAAQREAAEQAAEKNQEFERLATERKVRLDELEAKLAEKESLEENFSQYRSTLDTYANSLISELNLPKGVASLVEKMDPKERLEWYTENKDDFSSPPERLDAGSEADDEVRDPKREEEAERASASFVTGSF